MFHAKLILFYSIIANGGKQAVIVVPKHEDEPEALVVVYDGFTTPSDVQAVINKEVFDIFKPSWVKDSVALRRKAPFKKKHFFYVSSSRSRKLEDDQDEDMDMDNDESRSQTEDVEVKEEQKQELHADWFKAEETEPVLLDGNKSDSETEDDDSENEDVVGEAEADVEDDSDKAVKMGESEGAMEYDQDHIFKHLFFYLDSPENAVRHEMASKKKQEQQQEINQSFSELKSLIVEHGGRVVNLNDPTLTHIVFDKRDTTRRLELIKRERSRPSSDASLFLIFSKLASMRQPC
ncbi:hypothetical protein BT96DRAFT_196701 [Gymnopus androsaceus JB14]|uniref:BRCT domain-containing protein n=1 Tax=Gymnopus androsaceus JB14 TaxID=1447944 RepID=A0A6A4H998_9AGAR|nr:hypothetical protein BT96DRAFT_196701 [Gymnopus androsaceus JB14]